jgi:hypothetical protein
MSSRYIFNTSGNYVAFLQDGYLFTPDCEWIGFIQQGNEVYRSDGEFMGYLLDDDAPASVSLRGCLRGLKRNKINPNNEIYGKFPKATGPLEKPIG